MLALLFAHGNVPVACAGTAAVADGGTGGFREDEVAEVAVIYSIPSGLTMNARLQRDSSRDSEDVAAVR